MTRDEDLAFAEDLLQGDDPAVLAQAAQRLKKNPDLRREYANQCFIHALLCSQTDMQDQKASRERITRVMQTLSTENARAGERSVRARRRRKRLLTFVGAAGSAALVLLAVTLVVFTGGPEGLPKAEAVVEMARQKSFEDLDRTYSLELIVTVGTRTYEADGWLYVRGADKVVMELETHRGRIVKGMDGKRQWVIPQKGPIFVHESETALQRMSPETADLPHLSMERILAQSSDLSSRITGKTEFPTWPGRTLILLECTPIKDAETAKFKKAQYMVDTKTGLVMRAELHFGNIPLVDKIQVNIQYSKEEKRADDFYGYEAHNADGRPLFDREKFREQLKERLNRPRPRDSRGTWWQKGPRR